MRVLWIPVTWCVSRCVPGAIMYPNILDVLKYQCIELMHLSVAEKMLQYHNKSRTTPTRAKMVTFLERIHCLIWQIGLYFQWEKVNNHSVILDNHKNADFKPGFLLKRDRYITNAHRQNRWQLILEDYRNKTIQNNL